MRYRQFLSVALHPEAEKEQRRPPKAEFEGSTPSRVMQ